MRSSAVIEFQDGIYDLDSGTFSSDSTTAAERLSCLNVAFGQGSQTIHFDKLLQQQVPDEQLREWLMALLGRCLHLQGYEGEDWKITPMLVGQTCSGKSTLIHILMSFFNVSDTAVVSDADSIVTSPGKASKFWAVLEVTADKPPVELVKSLLTGHATASIKLLARGIMAGNTVPDSWLLHKDITEHLVCFEFLTKCHEVDEQLLDKIRSAELPGILQRINKAYLTKAKKHKNKADVDIVSLEHFGANKSM